MTAVGVFAPAAPGLVWVVLGLDLVVLAAVAWDARRAAQWPLATARQLPDPVYQAEATDWQSVVENRGPAPVAVHLREVLGPELVATAADAAGVVPPGHRWVASHRLSPRRRGVCVPAPASLRVTGPWALGQAVRAGPTSAPVRIYPRARFGGRDGLRLKQALTRRQGHVQTRTRGASTELAALREYVPGDDVRTIHWKATARRRRPVVRETTLERHQHVVILVDCGRSMAGSAARPGSPDADAVLTRLDHALAAVIALARVAVAQQDRATLVLYSREVGRVVRVDGRTRSFRAVFEQLHQVQPDLDEPDHEAAAAWALRHLSRRSLVIVLTSVADLAGARSLGRALRQLRRRHQPLLVDLQDPGLVHHALGRPDDVVGAYAKLGAMELLESNLALSTSLQARGIDVLSLPAHRLAMGVVQAYLDLKARGGA